MILKYVIFIFLMGFCLWHIFLAPVPPGPVYISLIYILCPILFTIGLGSKGVFTWPLAGLLLIIQGHLIVGIIPVVLVIFTIWGNEKINKARRSSYVEKSDPMVNFIRYCKEYFIVMKGFYEDDASFAIMDPALGPIMDQVATKWVRDLASKSEDFDSFLTEYKFYSSEMKIVNDALDEYSKIYKNRKKEIIAYLKSIGHPSV